jgi:hypothetical protein
MDPALPSAESGEASTASLPPALKGKSKAKIEENDKVEELLRTFQSQLDAQQTQLQLLKSLLGGEGRLSTTPVVESSIPGTEEEASDKIRDNTEFESRAREWLELRSPDAQNLSGLISEFLEICQKWRLLWFSKSSLGGENLREVSPFP